MTALRSAAAAAPRPARPADIIRSGAAPADRVHPFPGGTVPKRARTP